MMENNNNQQENTQNNKEPLTIRGLFELIVQTIMIALIASAAIMLLWNKIVCVLCENCVEMAFWQALIAKIMIELLIQDPKPYKINIE